MSGRMIYEDRGTRISIMARVNAQRPDTLQQTGSRPTRKNPLADRGRAIHFGKDTSFWWAEAIAQPANEIEAATDEDAIKIAEKCLDDRDLALWQGPRLVTTLKSKARPGI